jgi:hypothetical protein
MPNTLAIRFEALTRRRDDGARTTTAGRCDADSWVADRMGVHRNRENRGEWVAHSWIAG